MQDSDILRARPDGYDQLTLRKRREAIALTVALRGAGIRAEMGTTPEPGEWLCVWIPLRGTSHSRALAVLRGFDAALAMERADDSANRRLKFRPLTESEVRFEYRIEPEDIDPGDQFDDPETVSEIRARIERNDVKAWCCIFVTARWGGFSAHATLGGVCLLPDQLVSVYAVENGLHTEALEALNREIQGAAQTLAMLVIP